jgi:hypothetical protein
MYVIGVLAVFETSNAQSPYFENNNLNDVSIVTPYRTFRIFYFGRIILHNLSL